MKPTRMLRYTPVPTSSASMIGPQTKPLIALFTAIKVSILFPSQNYKL